MTPFIVHAGFLFFFTFACDADGMKRVAGITIDVDNVVTLAHYDFFWIVSQGVLLPERRMRHWVVMFSQYPQ